MSLTQLENGTVYRGRIMIHHGKPAIEYAGGVDYIKEKLENQGLNNVIIWMDNSELPNDWPISKLEDTDVGVWGETQIWVEGKWIKPSGQYETNNKDATFLDHWVHKQASQPIIPVQPTCSQDGIQCVNNSDCCSQFCINGQCGVQPSQPICSQNGIQCINNSDCCSQFCINGQCGVQPNIDTNQPTCAYKSMSCENVSCCEGYKCRQDPSGYWGGGLRCFDIEETPADTNKTPIEPAKEEPPKQYKSDSSYWYILGSMLVGGVITAVGVKYLSGRKLAHSSGSLGVSEPAKEIHYKVEIKRWMIENSKYYVSAADLAGAAADNFGRYEYDENIQITPEWMLDFAIVVKKAHAKE